MKVKLKMLFRILGEKMILPTKRVKKHTMKRKTDKKTVLKGNYF